MLSLCLDSFTLPDVFLSVSAVCSFVWLSGVALHKYITLFFFLIFLRYSCFAILCNTPHLKKTFFFLIFRPCCLTCRILVPQPRMEFTPPALARQNLNHWTARKVSYTTLYVPILLLGHLGCYPSIIPLAFCSW